MLVLHLRYLPSVLMLFGISELLTAKISYGEESLDLRRNMQCLITCVLKQTKDSIFTFDFKSEHCAQ